MAMPLMLKIMIVIAVAIVVQYIFTLVYQRGYHKIVFPHYPGPCKNVVPINTGSADIAVTRDGLAFITSGLNPGHTVISVDPQVRNRKGSIHLFDFNNPDYPAEILQIKSLKRNALSGFNPHGISIFDQSNRDHITMFVVNHRRLDGREVVEVMNYNKTTRIIHHNRTISDKLFRSLNGIFATGLNSFYVTNDGFYHHSIIRAMERFSMFPWGNMLHYNGKSIKISLQRVYEFHGIAMSSDRRFLYVVSPYRQGLFIYERVKTSFHLVKAIDLGTSPVSVKVIPGSGDLLLGCFPIMHQVSKSIANFKSRGAAQVLRITFKGPPKVPFLDYRLTELFADDGDLISQSAVASSYKSSLLIGSLTDRLVHCDVKV